MKFYVVSVLLLSVIATVLAATTFSSSSTPSLPAPAVPDDGSSIGQIPVNSYDFWFGYYLGKRHGYLEAQQKLLQKPTPKPNCKPVGAFCTYHEDCCSFACLSYLGKCVSH